MFRSGEILVGQENFLLFKRHFRSGEISVGRSGKLLLIKNLSGDKTRSVGGGQASNLFLALSSIDDIFIAHTLVPCAPFTQNPILVQHPIAQGTSSKYHGRSPVLQRILWNKYQLLRVTFW